MTLPKKPKISALMATFFQLGACYLLGGAAASIVAGSIRPMLVTGVGTGILYKFFDRLDRLKPSLA